MYKLTYKEFIKDTTPPHWTTSNGPYTNGYWIKKLKLLEDYEIESNTFDVEEFLKGKDFVDLQKF